MQRVLVLLLGLLVGSTGQACQAEEETIAVAPSGNDRLGGGGDEDGIYNDGDPADDPPPKEDPPDPSVPTPTAGAGGASEEPGMVVVAADPGGGREAFLIDSYEARRVDGAATSTADAVPTVSLTFDEAEAACEAAGKRICSWDEWLAACLGPNDRAASFQDAPDSPRDVTEVCDVARTEDNTPGSLPSPAGSHPASALMKKYTKPVIMDI